ncbi:MAG TPA: TIGR02996 domain-containing protein, partial [Kofleriaceae bacterium]|nr:TIGR02996 domain-containing protein [Kofleriaceae bacterium]
MTLGNDGPLVRAIAADPDDDEQRLVLADALMQRGDPRGELIALQCAIARAEPAPDELTSRVDALLAAHGAAWTAELRAICPGRYGFVRGFVERVWLDASTAFSPTSGPALLAAAPLLRHITAPCAFVAAASDSPWGAVPTLELGEVDCNRLPPLALHRVQHLILHNASAWRPLDALLAAGTLHTLVLTLAAYLGADRGDDDDDGLSAWIADRQPALQRLAIGNVAHCDLAPLARLPLRRLALLRSGVDVSALRVLVASLPALEVLELVCLRTPLDGEALGEIILSAPALRRLRVIGQRVPALELPPHVRAELAETPAAVERADAYDDELVENIRIGHK